MVEGQHDEPVASILEPAEGAVLKLDNITWTWPFVGQADQETAAGDQALRGQIGMVVERRRRRLDLLANGFADMRGIVQRARDGLRCDPRDPRNIDDR